MSDPELETCSTCECGAPMGLLRWRDAWDSAHEAWLCTKCSRTRSSCWLSRMAMRAKQEADDARPEGAVGSMEEGQRP